MHQLCKEGVLQPVVLREVEFQDVLPCYESIEMKDKDGVDNHAYQEEDQWLYRFKCLYQVKLYHNHSF